MEIRLDEFVCRSMRVREQVVEHVLFHDRVAADRTRVTDEGRDLVSLHALDGRGRGRGGERCGIVIA